MKFFDGDFEYMEAARFYEQRNRHPVVVQTPEYKVIADSFVANIDRVMCIHHLPVEMAYTTADFMKAICVGRAESGLPIIEGRIIHWSNFSEKEKAAWRKIANAKKAMSADDLNDYNWKQGLLMFLQMFHRDKEQHYEFGRVTEGAQAILATMLTSSYATYEMMASDLWIAAVNKHPELAASWSEKNSGKNFSMADLSEHGFDLSKVMGTFLHTNRRVSFQMLESIQDAYEHAFGSLASPCFQPWASLSEAAQLRNLFAHRGGLVDRKFLSKMKSNPDYSALSEGTKLTLTGPVVNRSVAALFSAGVKLLRFVDEWPNKFSIQPADSPTSE